MEDIEESAKELENEQRHAPPASVSISRAKKRETQREQERVEEEPSSMVPGTAKVWVKTYGCSHNVSDSEYMQGQLAQYGYTLTDKQEEADLWLINSCTVKDPSQAAFVNVVNKAKSISKPVVVAGCVSQADRSLSPLEDVSVLGVSQIDRVVEVVEQTLQGNTVKLLAKKDLPLLSLPKVRKNPLVEIIPLSTGCLGACTYCKTKQARGKLGSYPLEAIVARAQAVIAEGVSEIWLSSEDTGAYGLDIGTNIIALLRALIAVLPAQGVMLRVGMTNPPYILQHIEEMAEILRHPCVFSFLHIPVQAGSDRVLLAMNREYTVGEFRTIADMLLRNVPEMTLATDIICGFPGETEEDFAETMRLVEDYRLAIVNISQFYPRPGTPAAKMKRVPTQVVKERSRRLTRLFEEFTPYEHLVGRVERVFFDLEVSDPPKSAQDTHTAANGRRQRVGHTKSYVKVLAIARSDEEDAQLPGACYLVRITKSQRFHVEGELLECVYPANYRTLQLSLPVTVSSSSVQGDRKESERANGSAHVSVGERVRHRALVGSITAAMFALALFAGHTPSH